MADAFTGEIRLFAFNFVPTDWALCNGQLLSIQQNSTLYSLLGVQYGGNGTSTFGLPDLRSRVAKGANPMNATGEVEGVEGVALDVTTTPAHRHSLTFYNTTPALKVPTATTNTYLSSPVYQPGGTAGAAASVAYAATTATPQVVLNPLTVGFSGAGAPHENRQPFLSMGYFICLYGIYPSRP